jgi:hypothetical protein
LRYASNGLPHGQNDANCLVERLLELSERYTAPPRPPTRDRSSPWTLTPASNRRRRVQILVGNQIDAERAEREGRHHIVDEVGS